MRVQDRPILPRSSQGEPLLAAIEDIFSNHSRSINDNAGSAEIIESLAELPNPADEQGRWYYVLGSSQVLFAYTNDQGQPDWLVLRVDSSTQRNEELYGLSADSVRTVGPWEELFFDDLGEADQQFYNPVSGIYTAPPGVQTVSVNVQVEWEITAPNNQVVGHGIRMQPVNTTPYAYPAAFTEYVSRGDHIFAQSVSAIGVILNEGDQFRIQSLMTGSVTLGEILATDLGGERYTFLSIITSYVPEEGQL